MPLYTVTGWGEAQYPAGAVLPVYGVYPDDFWSSSLKTNPPNSGFAFDPRRNNDTIAPAGQASTGTEDAVASAVPYLLAEAGGGMEVAYHRRPLITASDVAALVITHLGAGANLYGYYMFHGGSNPDGKRTSLQESAAVDHVYDLPVVSYDFQAPLREFGQLNRSYRELKSIHGFLNEFGGTLAPMSPFLPNTSPAATDLQTARAAVRAEGNRGYLFFNDYVRDHAMAAQHDLQFRIRLPSETLVFPRRPVDMPSGEYFIWPFNLELNGNLLKFASAQLLCSVNQEGEPYYFFSATPNVAPEFAFDEGTTTSIETSHGQTTREDGRIYVTAIEPGKNATLTATSRDGKRAHIIVLTQSEALNAWKSELAGRERLIISPDDVFFDQGTMVLRTHENHDFGFSPFPRSDENATATAALEPDSRDGIFASYSAKIPQRSFKLQWDQVRQADPSSPVKRGKYNPIAPADSDFGRAAVWHVDVPRASLVGISDLFLKITYLGDVARLYSADRLVGDDFYHGEPWEVGLKRLPNYGQGQQFLLKISPLRKDAPIFIAPQAWPDFGSLAEIATVESITLSPEYQVTVRFGQKKSVK